MGIATRRGLPREGPGAVAAAWTDEQRQFRDTVLEFAQRELTSGAAHDASATFPREAFRRCAELGLQGLPVPERYGGSDAGATTTVLALEALGYGSDDNGLIFALNAQMWACETPLVRFGSEAQKRRWLPGLCDGSLVAGHGMSEPGSGSDAFAMTTTARRDAGGYMLDGVKTFVTNAPDADVLLIFAVTDASAGFAAFSAFLVERGTPGLVVGPPIHKMGLRSAPMAELFLDGCRVGEDQRLGEAGAGMRIFNDSMHWERGCILAAAVGTMQRQFERCVAYARGRRQFGRPIGKEQAVSHTIAEMRLRLETCRLLLYRLASLLERGEAGPGDSAMTKLHISESFVQSSLDALQLHGGYGYMTEYELERDVRDALAARIYSGTSEMQRTIVARSLGL